MAKPEGTESVLCVDECKPKDYTGGTLTVEIKPIKAVEIKSGVLETGEFIQWHKEQAGKIDPKILDSVNEENTFRISV